MSGKTKDDLGSGANRKKKLEIVHVEKKSPERRELVNRLYFKNNYSKRKICREMGVSRHFVDRWTRSPDQDFEEDRRGWPPGKSRKWGAEMEGRIAEIRRELEKDPDAYYIGPTAVQREWALRYSEEPPSLRMIANILSRRGLAGPHKKKRNKGAARYLCYPEYTIYEGLGARVAEIDFLQRFLTGRSAPLHFMGFSFKKAPKLRYFTRIEAQTTDAFIEQCRRFFDEMEKPHYVKVDNCAQIAGTFRSKRRLSRAVLFLLDQQVVPIFSVPRKPFSQASIEGNNSVFSRKFWKTREFRSVSEVDKALQRFNESSRLYTDYHPPEPRPIEKFVPKVYYLRQVRELDGNPTHGHIRVANDIVKIPREFIQLFVLAEWNIADKHLFVYLEKDKELQLLTDRKFPVQS